MSDPSLCQITFEIKENMPEDMKKFILWSFTDYYEKYEAEPSDEEIEELCKKYPEIDALNRNDGYHNVQQQKCQLDHFDVENDYPLGVSIISLPRSTSRVDDFFALVGDYIRSSVCTLGIVHDTDYLPTCYYYYFDESKRIRKHCIETSVHDTIIGK